MPSFQTRQWYKAELLKKGLLVDQMLQCITKKADCSSDEAVKCAMNVLFTKFGNVFADIAIKKDIALDGKPKKWR